MADKVNNLQDMFLNSLRRSKTPVTMFLVKGVKLQGIITWFDNFSVLLRRDGQAQLIYKHAISTSCRRSRSTSPRSSAPFAEQMEKKKPALLQEVFLERGARAPASR
jgi:host factor-I protein